MKTKQVPYACPVCQGSGEQKADTIPGDTYRFLKVGELLTEGDEFKDSPGFWEKTSCVGQRVTSADGDQNRYRRKVEAVQAPKCKACKGTGLVWGTETDDSITITSTPPVWPVTIPSILPWVPSPYKPFEPYIGDPPWPYDGVTWCGSVFNPTTQKYEVIASGTDTKPCCSCSCSCSLKGYHTPDCINY